MLAFDNVPSQRQLAKGALRKTGARSSVGAVNRRERTPRWTRTASHDLAIIIVSTKEADWIRRLLPTVFAHIGDIRADVVVVDNGSLDDTAEMVESEFPEARTVSSENHGFGHANNRALMTCNARYVLFINPDTEVVEGTFAELIALMDERPTVGLVGCRQVTPDDRLDTTIRYFPNALRALGDALSAERTSATRPRWLGEREIDPLAYEREFDCDWTSGSFLLARRESARKRGVFRRALLHVLRRDRPLPPHQASRLGDPASASDDDPPSRQESRRQASHRDARRVTRVMYARKYFSPGHRVLYTCAVMLRHVLRTLYAGSGELGRQKRAANREVVAAMLGRRAVPFAAITSPVSVQTADPELRHAQLEAPSASRRGTPVAP